jgi:hypothetical protein
VPRNFFFHRVLSRFSCSRCSRRNPLDVRASGWRYWRTSTLYAPLFRVLSLTLYHGTIQYGPRACQADSESDSLVPRTIHHIPSSLGMVALITATAPLAELAQYRSLGPWHRLPSRNAFSSLLFPHSFPRTTRHIGSTTAGRCTSYLSYFSHGGYVNHYCREEVLEKFVLISASPRPTFLLLQSEDWEVGKKEACAS